MVWLIIMLIPKELDGNNVVTPNGVSPGYNAGMGFQDGSQDDIFM